MDFLKDFIDAGSNPIPGLFSKDNQFKVLKTSKVDEPLRQQIREDMAYLKENIPLSPEFLGTFKIPKRSRRLKAEQLTPIHDAILDIIKKQGQPECPIIINKTRRKIKKYSKTYPNDPTLQILNAKCVSMDLFGGGYKDKLTVLKGELITCAQALCFDKVLSIYNIIIFLNIYLEYLRTYTQKFNKLATQLKEFNTQDDVIISFRQQLSGLKSQIEALNAIHPKADNFREVSSSKKSQLKHFLKDPITFKDLKTASDAILRFDKNKKVIQQVSAGAIINFGTRIALLCTGIPILADVQKNILEHITDLDRDVFLQKFVVNVIGDGFLFKLEVDLQKKKELSKKIFSYCVKTAHLFRHTVLENHFQAQPFLKTIWITIESQALFPRNIYQKMLKQSRDFIARLSDERCKHKDTKEKAEHYKMRINMIADQERIDLALL